MSAWHEDGERLFDEHWEDFFDGPDPNEEEWEKEIEPIAWSSLPRDARPEFAGKQWSYGKLR